MTQEIQRALAGVFKRAKIDKRAYQLRIVPSGSMQWYDVTAIWDGFEAMPMPDRQNWIWERVNKSISFDIRKRIGAIFTESAREVLVSEELALMERR